jgi:hypothetical protein
MVVNRVDHTQQNSAHLQLNISRSTATYPAEHACNMNGIKLVVADSWAQFRGTRYH